MGTNENSLKSDDEIQEQSVSNEVRLDWLGYLKNGRFYDDQDLPLFQVQEPVGNREILIDIYNPRPFDIINETKPPFIYYKQEMHNNPKSPLYPTIISYNREIKETTTTKINNITPKGNFILKIKTKIISI